MLQEYEKRQSTQILPDVIAQVEEQIETELQQIGKIVQHNQSRVLQAFQKHQVGEHHFSPSTGYGYDDAGRETLEMVYATVFDTEAAIVRPQLISGTHAISTCLFGILRPGDELIYITGEPYDTLKDVIGQARTNNGSINSDRDGPEKDRTDSVIPGSLADFGIEFQAVPLGTEGAVDYDRISQAISSKTKMIGIQRSCGYDDRPSFSIADIEEMVTFIKNIDENLIIFVDNCYGEFVEKTEPTHVGVDLMAGSLIKNPGGGLAKSGGYIVGRQDLVDLAGTRLFAPGIGLEGGATISSLLDLYQGFFLAPHTVGEALKGAVFSSALLLKCGFRPQPTWNAQRTDLIQRVQFGTAEHLIAFCQGIQKAAPVNAHFSPEPYAMPGYEDPVIMAAGTFIQGASIEFSADGPIRPPYVGFMQGGLTYEHVKIGILYALQEMIDKNLLDL